MGLLYRAEKASPPVMFKYALLVLTISECSARVLKGPDDVVAKLDEPARFTCRVSKGYLEIRHYDVDGNLQGVVWDSLSRVSRDERFHVVHFGRHVYWHIEHVTEDLAGFHECSSSDSDSKERAKLVVIEDLNCWTEREPAWGELSHHCNAGFHGDLSGYEVEHYWGGKEADNSTSSVVRGSKIMADYTVTDPNPGDEILRHCLNILPQTYHIPGDKKYTDCTRIYPAL